LVHAEHPNVQFVSLRRGCELLTTHSWVFLGSMRKNGSLPNASIWQKSLGEDVIIANIDTGNDSVIFINIPYDVY
jgi:hypothetical protein